MAKAHRLIGVCLAQAHTFLKTDFLVELEKEAGKEGYGIVVFNSSTDPHGALSGNDANSCVYRLIRYERLAALVIFAGDLPDAQIREEMIHKAGLRKIPVIWLGGIHDRCISMPNDCEEAYKDVIRHVVREHGARDTFYLAGLREEVNSRIRLGCWQEVMREEGLPCGEDRIAFGNYIEKEARQITEKLIRERKPLPRAIFCANDAMAAAVCSMLGARGIRVPEDVIVTGFDGTSTAYLSRPCLTTCDSDYPGQAAVIMELIRNYSEKEERTAVRPYRFRPVFSESCGCPKAECETIRLMNIQQQSEMMYNFENTLFDKVDRMLAQDDLHDVLTRVAEVILPDSALYLNKSILNLNPDTEYQMDHPEDEMIMVPHCEEGEQPPLRQVYLKNMPMPSGGEGITILNIVHDGGRVCGYYAAHSENLSADFRLIKRVSDLLNLISSVQLGRIWRKQLEARLENNVYTDYITGLFNLKGLTRWYETFAEATAGKRQPLKMAIYHIHNYSECYETFGMNAAEEMIRAVSQTLRKANPEAEQIARISENQFAAVNVSDSEEDLNERMARASDEFYRELSEGDPGKIRPEVDYGYTSLSAGWDGVLLENMIHIALGEMYLSHLNVNTTGKVRREESLAGLYSPFNQLMEQNLFRFHFQPIVDVRTSTICAYEALMRTAEPVKLNPLEILSIARESGKLYEIDKRTIFGIMERYARENDSFHGRRVFINTIPGYFLNEGDCMDLVGRYKDYLDCFVFELLEDSPTTDEELARLKRICKPGGQTQIAIDDYGTGHSNMVNLLRYSPQIIKIDRGLINGIDKDPNRRMFVQNTIDFAHQNQIRALAEGVETLEEFNTVIECGIDLIQGYYTGRPQEIPAADISDEIRNRMVEANLQVNRFNRESKLYFPQDGEEISLLDLALQKYTSVLLREGHYVLNSDASHMIDFGIYIADGAKVQLTLHDVSIKGVAESTIRLGDRSRLELRLKGKNTLDKEGILVPASAALTVRGDGNLQINNTREYAVGIGSGYNDPYGSIRIETEGTVSIRASGEKILCLGGGRSAGEGIRVTGGTLELLGNGISVACLGSYSGAANIDIRDTKLSIHGNGNEVLLLGTRLGAASIRAENCEMKLSAACEALAGLGTKSGTAEAVLLNCTVTTDARCDDGAVFGSVDGDAKILFRNSDVLLHGEGRHVSGFGSLGGRCETRMEGGRARGNILAMDRMPLGNDESVFILDGGAYGLPDDFGKLPVSPEGKPIHFA